jgi:hypothetical protein
MDGVRAGRCLDGESLDPQPGGTVQVYPCTKRWHQYLSFGNGKETPSGSLHTTVPLHTRRRIAETGREQEAYMCFGVSGRGDMDEEDWLGGRDEVDEDYSKAQVNGDQDTQAVDRDPFSVDGNEHPSKRIGLPPLSEWQGKQLIATRCSNVGAIIEWIVIPFVVEEEVTEEETRTEDEEL